MRAAGLLLALLVRPAMAQDPVADFHGERVVWEVRYAGVVAGTAWASSEAGEGGTLVLEGGARNAPWYGKLYSIDDYVKSTWLPGMGSQRYETRFREGGFHQDQDMRLDALGFDVWRKQRIDGEWKEWTKHYTSTPGAEDPISAIHRLRLLQDEALAPTEIGMGWTFPVFSGDKTWPLLVTVEEKGSLETEALGTVPVRVLELRTMHKGMLEQRGNFRIWLTDDARRIPVKMVVKTNFGAIRVDLLEYQAPSKAP